MESMTYQEWAQRRQTRSAPSRRSRKKHRAVTLAPRERRRLLQLAGCVAIFVVTLAGKGVFPQQMESLRSELQQILHADTDFTAAFADMGRAISQGESAAETLAVLWNGVFAEGTAMKEVGPTLPGALYFREAERLGSGSPDAARCLALSGAAAAVPSPSPFADTFARSGPSPAEPEEPEVTVMAYSGPALPDNTTMDKYRLDVGETVTPALGWVSSAYGWREHPVDGGEKFHCGVDLAVNTGTPVLAFADGTVDYIGESQVYGLYLQLRHAGGVTSFYAHCGELLVQQGQTVKAGEQVAVSGATGNATGPHLHFEIKRNGVRLNPVYYIQTQ